MGLGETGTRSGTGRLGLGVGLRETGTWSGIGTEIETLPKTD